MSAFYDLNKTPRNILNQAIVRAIISENNGAWFDPSDLSTLFQDAAGTTPVTALEQPVGRWLDKSGRGNHATQSITASRPVISARKNLLLSTDTLSTQSVATVAAQQTLSFTGTGSVTLSGTATGTLNGTGANNRVSLTLTPTAGTLTLTVSGDVRFGQLEYSPTSTAYQRVNTATDYDAKAHFPFVRFDGVDDYLNLPYMGLYANESASIVSALSNFTNTSNMTLLSEGYNTSTNQIYLPMTKVVGSGYGVYVRNDSRTELLSYLPAGSFTTPVMVKVHIDSGSDFHFYRNGGLLSDANYSRAGTLTLNNATIGAARQVSLFNFFGGNLYGLIITKSALSDTDRRKCEVYLGRKAGVQL